MNPILIIFAICIILLMGYVFVVARHELRLELIKEETRRLLREHRA